MEETPNSTPLPKKRRLGQINQPSKPYSDRPRSLGLDELTGFCDYVIAPNTLRYDRSLRDGIASRHLAAFFRTIHLYMPILDQAKFESKYNTLRTLFGDRRLFSPTHDDPNRPQFVCLLYAVLAMGALYEDDREDSPSWASWYFAEAQDMLGRLLEAANLQLVQAALFLVRGYPLQCRPTIPD